MSILKFFQRSKGIAPSKNNYLSIGGLMPPTNFTHEDILGAYQSVGWWHAVVFRIALGMSEVAWTLFNTTDPNKPKQIFKHPILDLLHLANPFQTSEELIALDTVYMECLGESFWVLNYNRNDEPAEIILPYPTLMQVIPSKQFPFVAGYLYGRQPDQIPLDVNQVIHFKYPNPMNQLRGLGQASAIGVNLSAEKNADKWVDQFFYNSARPDGVIEFDYSLSDEQFDKLKKQWSEKYKGVNKAHQVALLEGGGKYKQIQNTVKDMDFPNLKQKNRDIILGIEGMPLSIMGISENVNKANSEAGDYTFARWVLKPRLDWKKAKLQEQLIPKFRNSQNLKLGFQEIVPETAEQRRLDAESGMRAGYLTVNEARAATGKDPLPDNVGDVLLIPLNLIPTPIKERIKPPTPVPPPASEETEEEIELESYKGGEGSGNFGHEGRPGEVGGSGGGGGDGGATGEEWAASLNTGEKHAVGAWSGTSYQNIREYQRTGKGDERTEVLANNLESALNKDGNYSGKAYRGVSNLDEAQYNSLIGSDTIELNALSSASMDKSVAYKFAKGENSVVFEIDAKSGVDISKLSRSPKEKEVILRKNTKYKVAGSRKATIGGRSLTILSMKEL